jgi:hypothetical protein
MKSLRSYLYRAADAVGLFNLNVLLVVAASSALHRVFRKRRLRPQDLPTVERSKKPRTTVVVTNPG